MAKQGTIPGTEQEGIQEVEDAAEGYVSARDARMKKTEKEVEAKDALIAVMTTHRKTVYKLSDGSIVTVTPGKKSVKVSSPKDDKEEKGDDE